MKKKEDMKKKEELDEKFRYAVPDDMISLNYIAIDELKQKFGYDEDMVVSKETIFEMIDNMWDEFNRLEDLEDKMDTQYISKDKIKAKIKELEEKMLNDYDLKYHYQKQVLQELLEGE